MPLAQLLNHCGVTNAIAARVSRPGRRAARTAAEEHQGDSEHYEHELESRRAMYLPMESSSRNRTRGSGSALGGRGSHRRFHDPEASVEPRTCCGISQSGIEADPVERHLLEEVELAAAELG